MMKEKTLSIANELTVEGRYLNVYHHNSKGVHLLSHGRTIAISIQSEQEKDYINISIVAGPGNMQRPNTVDLPAWLNYEFLSEGKFAAIHSNERVLLKIPAGLPEWKIKLTRPASYGKQTETQIIISDRGEE